MKYTKEQLDKIYENLPEELKEAIFSVETAEEIGETCKSYEITDERVGKVAKLAGHVLMGLLLPKEFAETLTQEIKLPKVFAQAISRNLNRLVFYPVKPALEQLHQIEIKVEAKVVTPKPEEDTEQEQPQEEPRGPDRYREEIE